MPSPDSLPFIPTLFMSILLFVLWLNFDKVARLRMYILNRPKRHRKTWARR